MYSSSAYAKGTKPAYRRVYASLTIFYNCYTSCSSCKLEAWHSDNYEMVDIIWRDLWRILDWYKLIWRARAMVHSRPLTAYWPIRYDSSRTYCKMSYFSLIRYSMLFRRAYNYWHRAWRRTCAYATYSSSPNIYPLGWHWFELVLLLILPVLFVVPALLNASIGGDNYTSAAGNGGGGGGAAVEGLDNRYNSWSAFCALLALLLIAVVLLLLLNWLLLTFAISWLLLCSSFCVASFAATVLLAIPAVL